MHLWRRFIWNKEWFKGNKIFDSSIDINEILNQYLISLPSSKCVFLSPENILHILPIKPQSACMIWENGIKSGMIPQNVSFKNFIEALLLLNPLFISLDKINLTKNQQDFIVKWQSWVPLEWRTHQFIRNSKIKISKVKQNTLERELYNIIPNYFVSSAIVKNYLELRKSRNVNSGILEWKQLVNPPLVSLIEWSDDYNIIRLSKNAKNCINLNNTEKMIKDNIYSLYSHPHLFHKVLKALALLLPTFKVSKTQVRNVYKRNFVDNNSVYYLEFGPEFILRFPDALTLIYHPEIQFALNHNEEEDDYIMLNPDFLHTFRGIPNSLYETITSTCNNINNNIKDLEDHYMRNFLHVSLPYIPRTGDATMLYHIKNSNILGISCILEENKNIFSLTIATIYGDVFTFDSFILSQDRLKNSGIPYAGLPAEVAEALTSSHIIKLIAVNSTTSKERLMEDIKISSLLQQHFNLKVQSICSLWKFILFVGIPVHVPPILHISFYQQLFKRLGGRVQLCNNSEAILAVMCGAQLMTVCEDNINNNNSGGCIDFNILKQMLINCVGDEAWRRRNLQLRIHRLGFTSLNELKKEKEEESLQNILQHLLLTHGPEVCFLNREAKPWISNMNLSDKIIIQEKKEEKTQEKKEEIENLDDEFLDALCPSSHSDNSKDQKKSREIKASSHLLTTDMSSYSSDFSKNKDSDIQKEEEIKENNNDNDNDEIYNAILADTNEKVSESLSTVTSSSSGIIKEKLTKPSIITNSLNGNDFIHNEKQNNELNDKIHFHLHPPGEKPIHDEYFQINRRNNIKNVLPPSISFTHINSQRLSGRKFNKNIKLSDEKEQEQEQQSQVKDENELINRLTREIIKDSQIKLKEGSLRNGFNFKSKESDLSGEFLRGVLPHKSFKRE